MFWISLFDLPEDYKVFSNILEVFQILYKNNTFTVLWDLFDPSER